VAHDLPADLASHDIGPMLGALIANYPAFRLTYGRVGRRCCRWIAERVNGPDIGLHTMITADYAELRDALDRDARHAR
jgi:hypothetical protein